jgi:hypothetical protein
MSYDPYEIEIDYDDHGSSSSSWAPASNVNGAPMVGATDIYGDAYGSTANHDAAYVTYGCDCG